MAAQANKLIDTAKRVVYKFTSDAPEVPRVLKIDAGSLNGALNVNNLLLGSGTDRKAKYRLSLKAVWYSVGAGYVSLSTDGDASVNTIINLSGSGEMVFDLGSDTLTVDCSSYANTTGNVYITTYGSLAANNAYTIIADFRKNAEDYSQGQFVDPQAFNTGNRSGGGGTGF